MPIADLERRRAKQRAYRRSSFVRVIEREPWELRTVLELVDPPEHLKIGSTFRWPAANSVVRITRLAPPNIRPTAPNNVVVCVVIV